MSRAEERNSFSRRNIVYRRFDDLVSHLSLEVNADDAVLDGESSSSMRAATGNDTMFFVGKRIEED
jgi:hypothetical protein